MSEEAELNQLRRLYDALQLQIMTVLESLSSLRESADYELSLLSAKKPGLLEDLARQQAELLEKESAELEKQAEKLAEEMKDLTGESPAGIK